MWDRDRHCEEFRKQGCIIQQDIFKCCLLQLAGPVFQRGGKVRINGDDRLPATPSAETQSSAVQGVWVLNPSLPHSHKVRAGLGKVTLRGSVNGAAYSPSSPPAHPPDEAPH